MAKNKHFLWTCRLYRNSPRLLRAKDRASEGELRPRLGAAAPGGAFLLDLRLGGASDPW